MIITSFILGLCGALLFLLALLTAKSYSDIQILGLSFGLFLIFFSVMVYNSRPDASHKAQ